MLGVGVCSSVGASLSVSRTCSIGPLPCCFCHAESAASTSIKQSASTCSTHSISTSTRCVSTSASAIGAREHSDGGPDADDDVRGDPGGVTVPLDAGNAADDEERDAESAPSVAFHAFERRAVAAARPSTSSVCNAPPVRCSRRDDGRSFPGPSDDVRLDSDSLK